MTPTFMNPRLRIVNPINGIDMRAVIYHRALQGRPGASVSAINHTRNHCVMLRPQLHAINGRPC